MRIIAIFLLFFPSLCISLETNPWLANLFELHWTNGFAYQRYTAVEGANPPLQDPSNDYELFFALSIPFRPDFNIDGEVKFVDTPRQSFSFRTTALQGRYVVWDDIMGDPVTFTVGSSFRYTGTRSLHDVSCPSHATLDVELNIAVGKEIDYRGFWFWRFWGYGSAGIGNRGSPWVYGILGLEASCEEIHQWALFFMGEHGFGKRNTIDINNFNGYGKIRQKSIDLSFRYGYKIGVWGTLFAEYQRRVMARLCPEYVNRFEFRYIVPFSF